MRANRRRSQRWAGGSRRPRMQKMEIVLLQFFRWWTYARPPRRRREVVRSIERARLPQIPRRQPAQLPALLGIIPRIIMVQVSTPRTAPTRSVHPSLHRQMQAADPIRRFLHRVGLVGRSVSIRRARARGNPVELRVCSLAAPGPLDKHALLGRLQLLPRRGRLYHQRLLLLVVEEVPRRRNNRNRKNSRPLLAIDRRSSRRGRRPPAPLRQRHQLPRRSR